MPAPNSQRKGPLEESKAQVSEGCAFGSHRQGKWAGEELQARGGISLEQGQGQDGDKCEGDGMQRPALVASVFSRKEEMSGK